MPIRNSEQWRQAGIPESSTACKVITSFRVGIPAAIDLNFRQFITSGKLFFAKLSFGFSKESVLNRN
ncbi:MAG: hypothetical protein SGI89_04665 [bacterium]|nr:hypothetical protein [bacterium]